MEKFYCDYCRILYDQEVLCQKCGRDIMYKIWIEVQAQQQLEREVRE